ncbi:DnaD domain protein [Lactococcus termiticola]|uniref:DnaD domain protein n=1 Tax=Lactococcus termiticola TaxID=2169526 RepID=UPI001403AA20|nr:DnaD domain protein [Lactococcus termiticola]
MNRGKVSFDADAFSLLYLPIIGKDAYVVYQLLRTFYQGRIMDLLDYLDCSVNDFEEATERLSAIGLIRIAEDGGDEFYIELMSPLAFDDFMADDFYKQLLAYYIGEQKVSALSFREELKGQEISKKFSDVYPVQFDKGPSIRASRSNFDLYNFKKIMRDRSIRFNDEGADTLSIVSMADKFGLDWFELFTLATENLNEDQTINTSRMLDKLSVKASGQAKTTDLTVTEREIIRTAKAHKPEDFLLRLKKQKNTSITDDEKHLLVDLGKFNISPEVQNLIFYYYLAVQQKANINRNQAQNLANDWTASKILTAEQAIERIRSWGAQQKEKQAKQLQTKPAFAQKQVKKAPEWSNSNYVNQTTAEEQAELDRIREEALRKIEGDK